MLSLALGQRKHQSLQRLTPKRKIFGVMLLCFACLQTLPAVAAETAISAQARQQSEALTEAFNKQDSFQADYLAVSAKGQARIRLQLNQQRRFALVSVRMDQDLQASYWVVIDYAENPQRPGLIKMFVVVPEAGLQQAELSFKETLASLDHPLGVLRFLKVQANRLNGQSDKLDADDWLPKTPVMELGLSEEHLQINLAVSTRSGQRFASWLEPELLATAVKIDSSPSALTFTLPSEHQLVIDRKTGMLLVDRWNRISPKETREIKQLDFGELQDQRPYQQQIPNFASLPVTPMPLNELYQQFSQQLTSELAASFLPQIAGKTLPVLNAAQGGVLRDQARMEIRAQVRRNLQPEAVLAYRAEVLQPAYQKYLQTHAQGTQMAFTDYLTRYLAAAENDPEHVQMPGLRQMAAQISAAKDQLLATLTAEQAQEMQRLWRWGWPSVQEAWALELLAASIERLQSEGH